jgi:hypothetical protein
MPPRKVFEIAAPGPRELTELAAELRVVTERLDIFVGEFKDERISAQQYRQDNRVVMASVSAAMQTLSGQFTEVKAMIADHRNEAKTLSADYRSLHDTVMQQGSDLRTLTNDVNSQIRPFAYDFRDERAEARGRASVLEWMRMARPAVLMLFALAAVTVWLGGGISDIVKLLR